MRSLLLVLIFPVGGLLAQPASITSIPVPASGQTIFDATGNMYFFGHGPVTPRAAQTQSGGGTCQVSNGFFTFPSPCPDAYLGKLDASGNRIFGTLLGGPTGDQAMALAVDTAGEIFVTGITGGSFVDSSGKVSGTAPTGASFPTTPNAAISSSSSATAFAAKLSADGSRFLYSTYLPDIAATPSSIAVDAQGQAYITGTSNAGHAFALKLSADGSAFLYNVSFGGTHQDGAGQIAVDSAGNVIIAGQTNSADFPVSPGAIQSHLKGTQNLFVTKLDPNGRIAFSTYLGGSGADSPAAVRLDSAANIYIAGQTTSLDFPTTSGSFELSPIVPLWNNAAPAGFVASLKADGTALSWSTYVISSDHYPQLGVTQLAVSASGETYVAALTGAGFPVTANAPQICFDGTQNNVLVAHLDSRGALAEATYAGKNGFSVQGLSLAPDGSILLASTNDQNIVKSQIHFGDAGSAATACLSPSVLNSATMSAGLPVVPGELITLTGFEIGPEAGALFQADSQGQVPRQLAGVQVFFDGDPAPVLYAQSRQINAIAPAKLSGKMQTTITVVYNGVTIGSFTAKVDVYGSPGIFRAQPGISSQAAAVNQDGTVNSASNPAARGSVVSVWGTGFGMIDPPCGTGGLNPAVPVDLAANLGVLIADGTPPGVPIQYNPALYAGSAPGLLCGVQQINLRIPASALPGVYQFVPWSTMKRPLGDMIVAQGPVEAVIFVK